MRRFFINSFNMIGLLAIISFFLLPSCKDNTDCEALIVVKQASDTTIVVPNAKVKISKMDVNIEGVTNAKGEFRHTFKLEAILDVEAWDETQTPPTYGKGTIRLEPDATVRKLIVVQ